MKEVAKYYVDDKFIITGRGLIFAGHIIEGELQIGNYIEFDFNGSLIKRKIKGISEVRNSIQNEGIFDKKNLGLLIECQNKLEMENIRESNLKETECLIFEK